MRGGFASSRQTFYDHSRFVFKVVMDAEISFDCDSTMCAQIMKGNDQTNYLNRYAISRPKFL